jgi:hypothetical protein
LIVPVLLALCYIVVSILAFSQSTQLPHWKVLDGVFWLVQAITQLVVAILIIHEKGFMLSLIHYLFEFIGLQISSSLVCLCHQGSFDW